MGAVASTGHRPEDTFAKSFALVSWDTACCTIDRVSIAFMVLFFSIVWWFVGWLSLQPLSGRKESA